MNANQERECREARLSEPVTRWLESLGFEVFAEVPVGTKVDLVGVRWHQAEIICVELKMCLNIAVCRQAGRNRSISNQTYAAVAAQPKEASLVRARRHGIGVIVVERDRVSMVQEPSLSQAVVVEHYRNRCLRLCRQLPKGGIGGKPNLKGDGPAQRCLDAVLEYKQQHRDASWREMFAMIPNHYASAASMQQSMKKIAFWRGLKQKMANREPMGV
jgi:hypothetical protein